jgi:hypothetical protein
MEDLMSSKWIVRPSAPKAAEEQRLIDGAFGNLRAHCERSGCEACRLWWTGDSEDDPALPALCSVGQELQKVFDGTLLMATARTDGLKM